jgi:cell division protein FtsB
MPERSRPVQLWLLLIVASLPVLVYLLVMSARKAIEVYEIREQQAAVRTEIARLKDKNVALRKELDYLRTDAYVEYAGRTELGLVRSGDHVVVPRFSAEGAPAAGPPAVAAPAPAPPAWQRWWAYFFDEER